MPDDKSQFGQMFARYTALSLILPAATFVGYAIGYMLDKAFGTRLLSILFLVLGIAAGFVELIRQVQKPEK